MRIGNRLGIGRQFSMRSLLVFVTVTALLCAAWRWLGLGGAAVLAFFIVSAIPLITLSRTGRRAFLMSWSTVYGPFVAMATYTTLCVSCSHCKSTVWTVLPCAPGLVPLELARSGLNLPRASDTIGFMLLIAVSAAMLVGTVKLVQSVPIWWRIIVLSAATAYETFAALAVLAMIRS